MVHRAHLAPFKIRPCAGHSHCSSRHRQPLAKCGTSGCVCHHARQTLLPMTIRLLVTTVSVHPFGDTHSASAAGQFMHFVIEPAPTPLQIEVTKNGIEWVSQFYYQLFTSLLSWQSATLKCAARDQWIGWSRILWYQQFYLLANKWDGPACLAPLPQAAQSSCCRLFRGFPTEKTEIRR